MTRERTGMELRAIRLLRWLAPDTDRNLAAEAKFLARGSALGAVLCAGRVELTLERGSRVRAGLRVSRVGVCIHEGVTPTTAVTVLTVRGGGLLELDGAAIGRGCRVLVGRGARLAIGVGTYVNDGTRLLAARDISIGKRCAIAWNVTMLDDDEHGFGPPPYSAPIAIEDDVWIGCNVTVLKGVTVGRGSVVAAGSVVTRSCPPRSLIGGAPAKVLRADVQWTDERREAGRLDGTF